MEQNGASNKSNGIGGKRRTGEGANGSRKRVKVTGTRISLRLRGSGKEDGESGSLSEKDGAKGAGQPTKVADDPFGSDSDLTEVEELEREIEEERRKRESADTRRSGRRKGKGAAKPKAKVDEESASESEPAQADAMPGEQTKALPIRLHVAPLVDPMLPPPLPPGFVEWETASPFPGLYSMQLNLVELYRFVRHYTTGKPSPPDSRKRRIPTKKRFVRI